MSKHKKGTLMTVAAKRRLGFRLTERNFTHVR